MQFLASPVPILNVDVLGPAAETHPAGPDASTPRRRADMPDPLITPHIDQALDRRAGPQHAGEDLRPLPRPARDGHAQAKTRSPPHGWHGASPGGGLITASMPRHTLRDRLTKAGRNAAKTRRNAEIKSS